MVDLFYLIQIVGITFALFGLPFLICCMGQFLFSVIHCFHTCNDGYHYRKLYQKEAIAYFIAALICFMVFSCGVAILTNNLPLPKAMVEAVEAEEQARQQKYETYDIYLDGQLVEYGTIDIDQNDVSIDDESESIYLTRKVEVDVEHRYTPIIMPRN